MSALLSATSGLIAGAPGQPPRRARLLLVDDKPVNIQAHIGVRPIFAAGNSAGDREMLEYASTGPLASLALVIDHDDAEREDAYGGASFTDPGAEPILATADRLGWSVVSMRRDWATVFGE